MPQRRLVETGDGRRVWVNISDGDILRAIGRLPHNWPDHVRRRYAGESVESLQRRQRKLSPEDYRKALAMAFALVDQQLYYLAERRAHSPLQLANPDANPRLIRPGTLEDVM
jgi:hypothetical protein